jgi:hypothetical protein
VPVGTKKPAVRRVAKGSHRTRHAAGVISSASGFGEPHPHQIDGSVVYSNFAAFQPVSIASAAVTAAASAGPGFSKIVAKIHPRKAKQREAEPRAVSL